MALFKRKPHLIDAEQFLNRKSLPRGVEVDSTGRYFVKNTRGQKSFIYLGEWAVLEASGKGYYVLSDSVLKKLYDAVDGDVFVDAK